MTLSRTTDPNWHVDLGLELDDFAGCVQVQVEVQVHVYVPKKSLYMGLDKIGKQALPRLDFKYRHRYPFRLRPRAVREFAPLGCGED